MKKLTAFLALLVASTSACASVSTVCKDKEKWVQYYTDPNSDQLSHEIAATQLGQLANNQAFLDDCLNAIKYGDPADIERERRAKLPGASIGMTKSQVINKTSWGKPNHINTTTTRRTEREQWVYTDSDGLPIGFLYFTNGILDAIQN